MDIAYGMSATFLFDTIMVVVFPLLGRAMGLSDAAFGLWAGTAVNDTSSVVATATPSARPQATLPRWSS